MWLISGLRALFAKLLSPPISAPSIAATLNFTACHGVFSPAGRRKATPMAPAIVEASLHCIVGMLLLAVRANLAAANASGVKAAGPTPTT